MKIGIDASRYTKEGATGVEWYSWHIINGLVKEITKNTADRLVLYSKNTLNFGDTVENRVVKAKRLWTLWALSREISKSMPDVLFVPSHTLPLRLPARSIITIHDLAFKYLPKSYSFFQYHYLNWSTRYAVKHADKIIVPSMATSDDLIKFFKCPKEKIVHINHGFCEQKEQISEESHDKGFILDLVGSSRFILFIGRLESKKNLVRLVEAFAKFSQQHDEYKLVLAGKRGLGFKDILKTVNELGLMQKVIMPGYIDEKEKELLYNRCEMFAFCSLYEGFGLPILEAFYYGKPVLTSNVSAMKEVGGQAVLYVDPYDIESIVAGIEILADNKEQALKLVEKGKDKLKEFSWEKASKETLNVLHG